MKRLIGFLLFAAFALGQGPGDLSQNGMPAKVTQLPSGGRNGDVVSLINDNGSNLKGLYYHNGTGWICTSCGGGGVFTAGQDLSGSNTSQTVIGIRNHIVDITGLADKYFLYYDLASTTWKVRTLVAGDIPSISAALITSGTLNEARLPGLINGDKTFTGNISANSYTSTGTGESLLDLVDNLTCSLSAAGHFGLKSCAGVIGITFNGGVQAPLEFQTNRGIANGYAPLDASAFIPTMFLGSGVAGAAKCLLGNQTWGVCGSGVVNTGVINHLAIYLANGSIVDNDPTITNDQITLTYLGTGGLSVPNGSMSSVTVSVTGGIMDTTGAADGSALTVRTKNQATGTTGAVFVQAGNRTTTAAGEVGTLIVGNSSNATTATANTAGTVEVSGNVAPAWTSSGPGNGQLYMGRYFGSPASFTANNVLCFSTTVRKMQDCPTSALFPIAIGISTNGTSVKVRFVGESIVNFDGTYSPAVNWFACTSATVAGQVTPQVGACAAGRQVGIFIANASGATSGTIWLQFK
jgi:hypothetical protein